MSLALLAFFQACKVSRTAQQTTDTAIDSATVSADTLTTVSIQDSVELNVYRVFPDTIVIAGVGDIMMGTNYLKCTSCKDTAA